ncbi:MAG: restriction endonuclease [Roseburia sp.]|nr:restriction endonuclease [Roseburia sp.]
MNLHFDESLGEGYKSKAQKIRVMSESWVSRNMFCPCCGNSHIAELKNNAPVADMKCNRCGAIFELKSKEGKIGKKINDGAYATMLKRITDITNPELFVMRYSADYIVTDFILIPKFFFVPQIIEKRKPLAAAARRAGWTGCNILYSEIPEQGKIRIIKDGIIEPAEAVVERYAQIKSLETANIASRSWLLDVLNCVNDIETNEFYLQDVYAYTKILQARHSENHNIEAKIRQQLQFLRDKGFIEFLGRGHYKKRFIPEN